MRGRRLALSCAMVGIAACAEFVVPTSPERLLRALRMSAQQLTIDDGQSARLTVTALDQTGQAFSGLPAGTQVVWSSTATDVAAVDDTGLVRANHPGSAQIQVSVPSPGGPIVVGTAVVVLAVPTTLAAVAGDAQTAAVATRLPQDLYVKVADRHGDGVPGVAVAFAVTAGHGVLTTPAVNTDSTGRASAGLTLDTQVGAVTVTATSARLPGALAHFSATAQPGPTTVLAKVSGDAQIALFSTLLPAPLVVSLADAHGNATPGVTVTWQVTVGGGSLSVPSSVSDAQGHASATWTLGAAAGAQGARAGVGGVLVAAFSATALAPVASVAVAPPSPTVIVGTTAQLTATTKDAAGSVLTGRVVTWATSDASVATVDAAGLVTAVVPGGATLTATSEGVNGTAAVTVIPAPPDHLTFATQPSTVQAGQVIAPAVQVGVRDAFDNAVTGFVGSIALAISTNPGSATLGGTVSRSVIGGTATFNDLTLGAVGTGYVLSATATGLPAASSAAFDVTAAVVRWTNTSGGLWSVVSNWDTGRVPGATDTAVIDLAGSYAVDVDVAAQVAALRVGPAVASGVALRVGTSVLSVLGPVTVAAGGTLQTLAGIGTKLIQAGALTNLGAVVLTDTARLTISGGTLTNGADIIGTGTIDVSAAAAFQQNGRLQPGGAGTGVLTITGNVTFGSGAVLEIGLGGTTPGTDQDQLVVSGTAALAGSVPVTFTGGYVPPVGAVFNVVQYAAATGALSLTLPTLATDLWQTTQAATYLRIETISAGPPPAAVAASAGDAQTAPAGTAVAVAPAVLVTDGVGAPVPGVVVTFAVASGGGSVAGAAATTGSNGIATAGSWTLGAAAGTNTLTATVAGAGITGNPVTFTATGISLATMQVDVVGPDLIGLALTNPLEITLAQPAGVGGVTVTITTDNPALITPAAPGTVVIPQGQTTGLIVLNGLALGTTTVRANAPGFAEATLAVQVSDLVVPIASVDLSTGFDHGCALRSGGVAWCWGLNDKSQLGVFGAFTLPVQVVTGLRFTTVAAGTRHSCALTSAGAAYCWGDNNFGQLGGGSAAPPASASPVAVGGGITFAKVLPGEGFTCGLSVAGAVYCWGDNGSGQIGDGTGAGPRFTPTLVSGSLTFKDLSLSFQEHVCALTTGGAAYCWGSAFNGSLGDGTSVSRTAPTAVAGGVTFEELTSGLRHSCGRTAAGAVYCWGDDQFFQLGSGTPPNDALSPALVQGAVSFASVAAGYTHTCGLTSGGSAYCWGENTAGGLGDGTQINRVTPVSVQGAPLFRRLGAGTGFTCGVTASDEIWCWGSDNLGQLADGQVTPRSAPYRLRQLAFTGQPTAAAAGQAIAPAVTISVTDAFGAPAGAAGDVVSLAIGANPGSATLGGTATASAATGTATFSNLTLSAAGTGYTLIASLPGATSAASATFDIAAVPPSMTLDIAGPDIIGLALTNPLDVTLNQPAGVGGVTVTITSDDGAVITAAAPGTVVIAQGQTTGRITLNGLGLGTTTVRATATGYAAGALAVQVSSSIVPVASVEISAGSGHGCGLRSGGDAYCWGSNSRGQLGDQAGNFHVLPTPAASGLTFVAISAGNEHTCAVTAIGQGYCWGYNAFGQLGLGSTSPSATAFPLALPAGFTWAKLLAGNGLTCGLTTGGAVYCWGFNIYGAVGDGTTSQRVIPAQVVGNRTFKDLALFDSKHVCALTTGGEAYCWGANFNGAIGDGTTAQRLVPTAVSGGLLFESLASGDHHSCGRTTAGVAYCWGDDEFAQLGSGVPPTDALSPRLVQGGITFASLAAGFNHNCGLTGSGAAYCWGSNIRGAMGDGTITDRITPVPVTGGLSFRSISSGGDFTCGVTTADEIWCWGNNSVGQIGDGTTTNRSTPLRITPGGTAAQLTFLTDPSTTAAGATITPAVQIAVTDAFGAAAAAAGTMTMAIATDPNGGIAVLGGTTGAAVVNGTATFSSLSINTPGSGYVLRATLGTVTALSASFSISGSAGPIVVTVAGTPGVGIGLTNVLTIQLPQPAGGAGVTVTLTSDVPGIASVPSSLFVPPGASAGTAVLTGVAAGNTTIRANATGLAEGTVAVQAGDILSVTPTPLTTGDGFSCAVVSSGSLKCWGANGSGQLGDGTTTPRLLPTASAGGFSFVAVSAGNNHACGLLSDGSAYCWGANDVGQLGTGGTSASPTLTPVAVSGGLKFARIRAGAWFTCGLTTGGGVYCWGQDGGSGRIGNNSFSDQPSPTRVTGTRMYLDVSLFGNNHACALATTGAAYCWGYNFDGEIGNNSQADVGLPTLVSGARTYSAIASATYHSCALQASGAAWCWGDNNVEQLGWGTPPQDALVPGAVLGGNVFTSLFAGGGHTCGLTSAGVARCWGFNDLGSLGDGTITRRLTPVTVSGGLTFSTLALGENFSCGLTQSGSVYCWGYNASGQLGDGFIANRLTPVLIIP